MPINYLRTDSGAFTLVLSNFLRESIMGFQIGYLSTDLKISIKALEDSSKAISSMDYFEKNKQYIFEGVSEESYDKVSYSSVNKKKLSLTIDSDNLLNLIYIIETSEIGNGYHIGNDNYKYNGYKVQGREVFLYEFSLEENNLKKYLRVTDYVSLNFRDFTYVKGINNSKAFIDATKNKVFRANEYQNIVFTDNSIKINYYVKEINYPFNKCDFDQSLSFEEITDVITKENSVYV